MSPVGGAERGGTGGRSAARRGGAPRARQAGPHVVNHFRQRKSPPQTDDEPSVLHVSGVGVSIFGASGCVTDLLAIFSAVRRGDFKTEIHASDCETTFTHTVGRAMPRARSHRRRSARKEGRGESR